jgi:hypothetical protein
MNIPLDKIVIDCGDQSKCTMLPFNQPPSPPILQYGLTSTTITWLIVVGTVITVAFIISTAIVRYKGHEERGQTERDRIRNPPKQCPTCGDKIP